MSLFLKLFYSVLLIGIVFILAHELYTVWLDKGVYIGAFEVVSDGGTDTTVSEAFPKRVVAAQTIMAQQLTEYQSRRGADAANDTTYTIPGMRPLELPPQILAGVEISVQSINIRQLLTAIRRGFLAPNEVSGHVTVSNGSVIAAVDWPQGPELGHGQLSMTRFLTSNGTTVQEAATSVACSISWARAVGAKSSLGTFPRAQFCDFVLALGNFYALEGKASTATGLDATQTALVRKQVAVLRSYYGSNPIFPDIYRLRADLLDLVPEQERRLAELVDAQEDRLRYAMLSAELKGLSEESKRMAALALARPAITLEDGHPKNVADNWAGLLKRQATEISTVSAGTGLVKIDSAAAATGFIVAPGVMLTTTSVPMLRKRNVEGRENPKPAVLCIGPSVENCQASFSIGQVLFGTDGTGSGVALMEIAGHDPVLHPPLALADAPVEANVQVGRYAYVVGYPFFDQRMPKEFMERLLGKEQGRQRLMPGRILAFGAGSVGGSSTMQFTTDISTTGGTGGGPLVDMLTGKVIGMSYAGIWQGQRGKFAYALPIPAPALEIIKERLRSVPAASEPRK